MPECSTKLTWEAAAAGSKETFQEQHSWVSGRNQSPRSAGGLRVLHGVRSFFLDGVISGRRPQAALRTGRQESGGEV